MNSIEDIAKMAIEEVGAELEQMENSRFPSSNAKAPKPLRAANDALNAVVEDKQAAQLNAASVMKESQNTLDIANALNDTLGAEIRVFGEVGEKNATADVADAGGLAKMELASLETVPNAGDKNFLANATLTANAAIGTANINSLDSVAAQNTSTNSEKEYLLALKERLEVLFAGLKNGEGNLSLRLDLTIRFLEFLLANTNERLTKLPR